MELTNIYGKHIRGEQLTSGEISFLFMKLAQFDAIKSTMPIRKSSPDLVEIHRRAHQWIEWIQIEKPKLEKRGDLGAFLASRTLPQLSDFCKLILKL